jgi:CelD/BcsL family acetyltransferase involved in cellulose biosynthesis
MSSSDRRITAECGEMERVFSIWAGLHSENPPERARQTLAGFRGWHGHLLDASSITFLVTQLDGRPQLIFPVSRTEHLLMGVGRLRVLQAPGDLYWSCPEPIVGVRGRAGVEQFVADIAELPGWDVFETGPLLETSVVPAWLEDAARRRRVVVERFGERESVGISLAGTWESYCATRSRPMSQELRKLSRQGALRFEDYRGGVDLPEKMSHFFRVEASGWKGEQGTAIACHPEAMQFYLALAAEAAAQGWLRLYLLYLDGQCLAANFALCLGRIIYSEKIGFDAAWSRFSPGHVLRRLTLEHLFETGETDLFDMLPGGGEHRGQKDLWGNCSRRFVRMRLHHPRSLMAGVARRARSSRDWIREASGWLREKTSRQELVRRA